MLRPMLARSHRTGNDGNPWFSRRRPAEPSERLAARVSLADAVPVRDPVLAELPAQLDELAVAVREEVDQADPRVLELDPEVLEPAQRRHQVLLGAAQRAGALVEPVAILLHGSRPAHAVLGDADLVGQLVQLTGELDDLPDEAPDRRQHPVRLVELVRPAR